ncbi:MAG: hypothetical protein AUG49_15700 [Catenulispora sp. 13_1_20CM_3_70_7]|nr:MAG: hypothetical protein AUG49_15700 [Catenulispora sp. 13_1_20CM_3_70_7]
MTTALAAALSALDVAQRRDLREESIGNSLSFLADGEPGVAGFWSAVASCAAGWSTVDAVRHALDQLDVLERLEFVFVLAAATKAIDPATAGLWAALAALAEGDAND